MTRKGYIDVAKTVRSAAAASRNVSKMRCAVEIDGKLAFNTSSDGKPTTHPIQPLHRNLVFFVGRYPHRRSAPPSAASR